MKAIQTIMVVPIHQTMELETTTMEEVETVAMDLPLMNEFQINCNENNLNSIFLFNKLE